MTDPTNTPREKHHVNMPATVVSIQGERQARITEATYADQGYVDDYVSKCSDGVALCRDRRRHNYPPTPRASIRFDHIDLDTGYAVRFVACADCGCAVQMQLWEAREVRQGGTIEYRWAWVASETRYQKNEHGEEYVAHGHGTITQRAFREALASQGMDEEAQAWARDAVKAARRAKAKKSSGA